MQHADRRESLRAWLKALVRGWLNHAGYKSKRHHPAAIQESIVSPSNRRKMSLDMKPILEQWSDITHPVIGMVHLRPLPGSPRYADSGAGDLSAVIDAALADAQTWRESGANGLMVENFGDVPFYKGDVPRQTVAAMTAVAAEIRRAVPEMPLGINVLRNDGLSAMAVATVTGASYIRVNVLSGAAVTDQGVIEGRAAELMRYRAELRAHQVKVLADVRVKHASPLAERPLKDEVEELVQRAGADAVIVSGTGTGKPTDPSHAAEVKAYAGNTPVLIGSGADVGSIPTLKSACDGFIVGSAAKPGGAIDALVDGALAKQIVDAI